MITRFIKKQVLSSVAKPNIVTGIFGARKTGKTWLMEEIKKELKREKILMVQGENLDVAEILSSSRLSLLQQLVEGYKYLFIDEAQKIPDIGTNLKLMVDSIKGAISFFEVLSLNFVFNQNKFSKG